jgi:hypothetical protein
MNEQSFPSKERPGLLNFFKKNVQKKRRDRVICERIYIQRWMNGNFSFLSPLLRIIEFVQVGGRLKQRQQVSQLAPEATAAGLAACTCIPTS